VKETKLRPKPTVNIENPIWDSVLKATTFFKSSSIKAVILEKNIVKIPTTKTTLITLLFKIISLKFIIKIKPAVTSVLLWTRDLTGVGALIAFGNQPLKGNWALLVNDVRTNIKPEIYTKNESPKK